MSSTAQRHTATIVKAPVLTLAERLEAIGIVVPNQTVARHYMRASQMGVRLSIEPWKLRLLTPIRILRPWNVFDYDDYASKGNPWIWGSGPVPQGVEWNAKRINAELPHVELIVCAKKTDPWFIARDDGTYVILNGWIYDRYGNLTMLI